MTDAECDALAKAILSEIVEYLHSKKISPLEETRITETDELVPVYGAESSEFGAFLCELMPHRSIKTIIDRCERLFDIIEIEYVDGQAELPIRRKISELLAPEARKPAVEMMARMAAFHFIDSFKERLRFVLEDAVNDTEIIANGVLADVLAKTLEKEVVGDFTADARDDIEANVRQAAEKHRKLLRSYLNNLPNVIAERGRGAPIKTQFKRRAECQKFLTEVKAAYSTLRLKGKVPTKTDVARALGIGGDPQRGGQSALQVLSAKLKRCDINYKKVTEDIEAELDK